MQKVKQLNIRLDAMENNQASTKGPVRLSEQEARTMGLNNGAQYIKITNASTGATFYYPDNGRLQNAED